MLRPARTVHVTTKEEVDAALATADQITVEGDDELLSYAINKAASDGSENQIAIEIAALKDRPDKDAFGDTFRIRSPPATTAGSKVVPPRPGPVPSRSNKGVVIAVAVIALLIVSGAIGWYLTLKGGTLRPDLPSTIIGGGVRPEPAPRPAAPAIPGSEFWINFSSMLWPLVAVVAIVALFFIARQAISSGSNVTIIWKVTEKVQGRVVITKVRQQVQRRRAAA